LVSTGIGEKEFRFGEESLKIGKMVLSEKITKERDSKVKKVEVTPDNRPIVSRNAYSENVFFNMGYGAWRNGLTFWGASKIAEFIEDDETPDEKMYEAKRFIPL